MSGLPWSKWFWADWRSDPGLRSCSAHARGVWMDCLCIAAEADPTGYVLVHGRTPTITDLARLTGEPEAAVQAALEELERNGVFSRDRHGRVYNRRMVRDARKANEGRKYARKRWSQTPDKEGGNTEPNGGPNGGPTGNPHAKKPEARSQNKEEERKTASPLPEGYSFYGRIIRLTDEQFRMWLRTYHGIPDILACLGTLDAFYDETLKGDDRKRWFIRCSAALDKKHQEAIAAKRHASRPLEERYPNEGVYA